MQLLDGRLIHSPSDLAAFLECPQKAILTREVACRRMTRPTREDALLLRLAKRGYDLEERFRAKQVLVGRTVVVQERPGRSRDDLIAGAATTIEHMGAGVDVIMQAVLFDGDWLGMADALVRVPGTSNFGGWTYEVADMKLRGYVHAGATIQLSQYTAQLAVILGHEPRRFHVHLGDGSEVAVECRSVMAFYRHARAQYLAAVGDVDQTIADAGSYPWRIAACRRCPWLAACDTTRRHDDHVSLVEGVRRDTARRLASVDITDRHALASIDEGGLAVLADRARIAEPSLRRLRASAKLALDFEERGEDRSERRAIDPHLPLRGLWRLPKPSTNDLYFHMETDPLRAGKRLVFGAVTRRDLNEPGQSATETIYVALDADEESTLLANTMRAIASAVSYRPTQSLAPTPDPHVVVDVERRGAIRTVENHLPHVFIWGTTTVTALQGAAARQNLHERTVRKLIEHERFVDLRGIVREAIRTARPIDELADLDPYTGYMPPAELDGSVAPEIAPLVAFDQLLDGEPDARATLERALSRFAGRLRAVRDWLWTARLADEVSLGAPPTRPSRERSADDQIVTDTIIALQARAADLRHSPDPHGARESRASNLLADLIRWHRREDAPHWIDYFAAKEMSGDDLLDHPQAIAGLEPTRPPRASTVRSDDAPTMWRQGDRVRTYRFPRGQEHGIRVGSSVECTEWPPGFELTVTRLDPVEGVIDLSAAKGSVWNLHPPVTAIMPRGPIRAGVLQASILRIATRITGDRTRAFDAPGPYLAVRRMILGDAPMSDGSGRSLVRAGEEPTDAARRLATELRDTVLAVQGPPGTGKTHTGARMILDLIRAGKRVGICANTHRAISNLVGATVAAAQEEGYRDLRVIQKVGSDERVNIPGVDLTEDNRTIELALQSGTHTLFAGTAWIFAREAFDGALDALFIDEAGQISLANAVGAGAAATQIFLLGDPQQLAQPSRGEHPPGAEASPLGHLIGDRATVPADRGIFLSTSYRMHEAICTFISEQVYEGRLGAHPSCARQRVHGPDALSGSGLRFLAVPHEGNRVEARDEVVEIARAAKSLIGRPYTTHEDEIRRLTPADIIVVAPYNRQVALLNELLPQGVIAGTVDRFQGREAPVVFYSMAASDASDLVRGAEFLFSRNRLNVAISRARALAVLTCSPDLLHAPCRTLEDVRLVNAFCRFVELAQPTG